MATNSAASKAADFITNLKLDRQSYPQIQERLAKKCMRHFLKKEGWHYVEELYHDNPTMLAYAIEDLVYDNRLNEALSVYVRRMKGNEEHIKKQDVLDVLEKVRKGELNYVELPNPLAQTNVFGPSDFSKYLTLGEFGVARENVLMVDDATPNLEEHLKELFESPVLGFDTESLVGLTKLEQESEGLATIQVASHTKVLIFDALKLKSPLVGKYFHEFFTSDKLKLGHAVAPDLKAICVALSIPKSVERVIDTWQIFKGLFPEEKHSNLAHICKKVLGKEICKAQTLTDWRRRPLRDNQLHYAAMDAFVVLKLYETLLKDFGEQYLKHFIEEDELQ